MLTLWDKPSDSSGVLYRRDSSDVPCLRRRIAVKRAFDIVLILLTAPVWLPLIILITLATWLILGYPAYFTQLRAGRGGEGFRIIKFRTMTRKVGLDGNPLPDAMRLTPFGRFLRSTSLDELPECWNVLRGDMSLVGPRPLLMDYLPLYTSDQARRHDVLPGITGWAQVNGRNAITWEEKFLLDLWYVEHQSLVLDLKIILLTIGRVFTRDGISAANQPTMPRFLGTFRDEQP